MGERDIRMLIYVQIADPQGKERYRTALQQLASMIGS